MPIAFLRNISGPVRTDRANRQIGIPLAFIAGAANAGGFLILAQYTSHMTGYLSTMADALALGHIALLLGGAGALLFFTAGAACSSILINLARRRRMHSEYAGPLLVEASLLLVFGLLGSNIAQLKWLSVPATVALLCFIMGLQNAISSKMSGAGTGVRTTHVTGVVTDIGIELGKLIYWNRIEKHAPVLADRAKLRLLGGLLGAFFVGGVCGALGFKHIGFISTVPLALVLVVLAAIPVFDDLLGRARRGA